MSNEGREIIVARLIEDLVGPSSADETITDKPSDRYLLGFLSPKETHVGEDEDDRLESAEDDEQDAPVDSTVSLGRTMRPSTMGLSFAARSRETSAPPTLAIRVQCGTYEPIAKPPRDAGKAPPPDWKRTAHDVNLPHVRTSAAPQWLSLAEHGLPEIKLFVRAMRAADAWSVTVALINDQDSPEDAQDRERCTVFQSSLSVRATDGSRLVARPSRRSGKDADALAAALLYRDAREFAVGHTCSASWEGLEHDTVQSVCTEWVPTAVVPAMSSSGDDTFAALSSHSTLRPLSPGWLATQASDQELASALREVPACYERWIAEQREKLTSLSPPLLEQANRHLAECQKSADRMREAVALVESDPAVRSAFRLAQQAMRMQYFWGRQEELQWFPFQLGFQLQALCSIAERKHPDRRIMDLLWFPTGGGKTEAYLALTAFTLFLRRLRDGSGGAGIAVLMRYTLRLLTIQQFERAAAMICACELLRRGHQRPPGLESESLGDEMFSIGLWVGGAATPNTVAAAKQASSSEGSNARQLSACPVCKKSDITWGRLEAHKQFSAECRNKQCEFSKTGSHLPVWTVDEDIYRVRPSLLIGTVDKFAQIVRKEECQSIFAADHLHHPIDLIIQDELHLISGPLGTIAAIYEIAIDELLSRGPVRPKILGSTATIRRADEQICALFNRATSLFPSPGLDAENSGFAVRDRKQPGRLYVGVSTVGRSPKFALQATSASLLQSGQPSVLTAPAMLDAYRTLVAYFNSLRELGGALVLMMDDVSLSLGQIAKRRGAEDPRRIEEPQELTSRVRSIRDVLDRIQKSVASGEAVDVVLASNMISVGVDVRRLSLMLVNGQPKGISEYIQATSRVGRGTIPGLVVVLYNDNKVRDRAHYETFAAWHQTLYREVEATSVTPFASRARDRALHAALVALVRYRVKGMLKKPRITAGPQRDDVKRQTEVILERVRQIEPSSLPAVEKELLWLCDDWLDNDKLEAYWDERGGKNSLLLSAERFAALQTMGSESEVTAWKTLNSMREVEPSTTFTLRPVFKNADSEAGNGEE